jgi:hypothetical protein
MNPNDKEQLSSRSDEALNAKLPENSDDEFIRKFWNFVNPSTKEILKTLGFDPSIAEEKNSKKQRMIDEYLKDKNEV